MNVRFFILGESPAGRGGFTLIEVLMVTVIVALLATVSMPLYGILRAKAGMAACMGNLRIIGLGLNGFMQDHNMVWPQLPPDNFSNETQRSQWWEDTLKPYGVDHKHWICPTDTYGAKSDEQQQFFSSYAVTQFDEFPNSAFRWKQPWAVERGGFHGGSNVGPNMLMPDGTIIQGYAFPSQ